MAEEHMSIAAVFRGEALTQEFEELFREHYHFVFRTAYTVTGSRQDAEDVLQTVFLRLLRREMPENLRNNPKAYLYRAAVNASLNTIRSRKNQRLADGPVDAETPSPAAEPPHDNETQPALLNAMAQLNPQAVEILILRYEHNYSDAEIAKMLGKSRGVIAVTLYRARARLKKLLRASSGEKL
jgi:RNA polymerase sigma-70 factor (ECF subfamily)